MTLNVLEVAPGFIDAQHLFSRRVEEMDFAVVSDMIRQSAAIHTLEFARIYAFLVQDIDPTKPQRYIEIPVFGELQPLVGEDDDPTPVRAYDRYQMAWPLRWAGYAWGDNRVTRAEMTLADANTFTVTGIQADIRWNRRWLLAAIFTSDTYQFKHQKPNEEVDLDIKPFANGDTDVYLKKDGKTYTDSHYLAQAASIDDANNPLPAFRKELTEHPLNTGDVVVYAAEDVSEDIQGLASFTEIGDPDIQPGSATDTVRSRRPPILGGEIVGKANRCWIVEWDVIPDGYLFGHCTGAGRVIGRREQRAPSLRGFFPEFRTLDGGTHTVKQFIRTCGYAPINRTGMAVMQIGEASYSAPATFDATELKM